ncbi:MAG: hypothetical protein GF329_18040 [Candidatus Lokiarchaeota archaeon]|nr:hypothetical protein [Candidatus Lokiarchaeota archaeon]
MALLFYSKKFIYQVFIIDDQGSAESIIKYDLQNISNDRTLDYISRTIFFDGSEKDFKKTLEIKIDDKSYHWDDLESHDSEIISSRDFVNKAILKIPIIEDFKPKDTINIEIKFITNNEYQNAFKNTNPSTCSVTCPYPIDKIIMEFKTNLKDIHFYDRGYEINIESIDFQDYVEQNRFNLNTNLRPQGRTTNKLIWEFDNPKVGNCYTLKFDCTK